MKQIVLVMSLCAVLAAGCVTPAERVAYDADVVVTEPAVVGVEPVYVSAVYMPVPVPAVLNSVEFLTPHLETRLAVTHTTYERTPGNTYRVVTTLKNLTDRPLRLQARTQFFTEERMHIEGPEAWQIIYIPPFGVETYVSHSYGQHHGYYFVEIQELHLAGRRMRMTHRTW